MNSLDLLILLLAVGVVVRGVMAGFLRSAGSLAGFVAGLVIGALVAPAVVGLLPATFSGRSLVGLAVFFLAAAVIGGLGEALGYHLSGVAERLRLRPLDAALGAAFGLVVVLLGSWLLAATFARSAPPGVATAIQGSYILRSLDHVLPPAPTVMARLERGLGLSRIPRVFTGLEPSPAPPVSGPNADAVNAAAAAAQAATVKIEGIGCGGLMEGSGFVTGPGLVATNAHVVAGINAPIVVDGAGTHRATVVFFDADRDFAVLRTSGLAAAPLKVADATYPRGTVGAVLGYPGGGRFTVSPSAILSRRTAVGRNIYDAGLIRRDIYELQAVVRPGNSGGPVVTPDGTVIGVVFATSTTNSNVGYALTAPEILPDLNAAATSGPVSSGTCVAD